MISGDVKTNVKQQEIKGLVVISKNYFYIPSKLEIQYKKDI